MGLRFETLILNPSKLFNISETSSCLPYWKGQDWPGNKNKSQCSIVVFMDKKHCNNKMLFLCWKVYGVQRVQKRFVSRYFHNHCQTHTIHTVYSLYKPAELLMWRETIHCHTKLSFCQTEI